MIKFKITIPKKIRLQLRPRQIDEAAKILVDDMKNTVPYDTGTLYRGIRKRKTTNGVEIYIRGKRNNEVAGYLIEGTKKHFIRPKGSATFKASGERYKIKRTKFKRGEKNKKVLAWTGAGGESYFSRGHWVRGIKKGYWSGTPRQRAIRQFASRIKTFLKSK